MFVIRSVKLVRKTAESKHLPAVADPVLEEVVVVDEAAEAEEEVAADTAVVEEFLRFKKYKNRHKIYINLQESRLRFIIDKRCFTSFHVGRT